MSVILLHSNNVTLCDKHALGGTAPFVVNISLPNICVTREMTAAAAVLTPVSSGGPRPFGPLGEHSL